jgi:hypothetical protein
MKHLNTFSPVMRKRTVTMLLAIMVFVIAFLSACAPPTEAPAEVKHTYPVTFDLATVIKDIPTDSIRILISINDGPPQELSVDFKTGETISSIAAKPGDKFLLRYDLYSGGIRIGQGVLTGTLVKDDVQKLEPTYDSVAIAQIIQRLAEGQLLPANLPERFATAIATVPLNLQLDSTVGVRFSWEVSPEGSSAVTGNGLTFSWTPGTDLIGKRVPIKVEAWKGDTRTEVRNWTVLVIAKASQGRLLSYTTRTDTTLADTIGTLTQLHYSTGLTVRETIGRLHPDTSAAFVAIDSIQLDNFNRPLLIRHRLSTGETSDSAFSWATEGQLLSLRVRQGSSILIDSFTWTAGSLVETRHFINDSLVERLTHQRDKGVGADTLLTIGNTGKWEVTRIFSLRYQGDNIVEKTWLLLRNGWQATRRETYVYTGLGSLLRYQRYREGQISELEQTEVWSYDSYGQALRRLIRDEKLSKTEMVQDFTWGLVLAKQAATSRMNALGANSDLSQIQGMVREALYTLSQYRLEKAGN